MAGQSGTASSSQLEGLVQAWLKVEADKLTGSIGKFFTGPEGQDLRARMGAAPGDLLCFNHNVEAVSARLLGEGSPIVDIEHTYLYSLRTQARILRDHGFEVLGGGPASNFISFRYLVQLLPLPRGPKAFLREQLGRSRLGRLTVRLPLGNLYVVGRAA